MRIITSTYFIIHFLSRMIPTLCVSLWSIHTGDMQKDLITLGRTNARNSFRRFGMYQEDRFSHIYVLGKTGTGKTTLLTNLIKQDILAGRGCSVLDPHGDMVEDIAQWAAKEAVADANRVTYLNAPDYDQPYGYNPLRRVSVHLRPLLASGMLEVFKKLWREAWGVRMEHIFRNVLLTLLDQPQATLLDIQRILTDKKYLMDCQKNVTSKYVRAFWAAEYAKYSGRYRADAIAPIQNKIGGFLSHPILCRLLVNPPTNLSLRTIMDQNQVLLVNLAKGRLGEDASHLFGGLLMTSIGLAAYSRADSDVDTRVPHFLYADEFQNFTTLAVVNMASELRKYRLGLILANQYLYQLEPDIRYAVLGNAGSLVSFRVGATDALFLEKEFEPTFSQYDLVRLPNYNIYAKIMVHGEPTLPFSAETVEFLASYEK